MEQDSRWFINKGGEQPSNQWTARCQEVTCFSVLLGVLELSLCPHPDTDLLDGRVYPHRKGSYVHFEGSVNFTIVQILICTRMVPGTLLDSGEKGPLR